MINPTDIAERYLALWNDPDHASRCSRLSKDWAADAHYADPRMSGSGRDGIADMIAGARDQFPGHAFSQKGRPDGHARFVRFSWNLAPVGGAVVASGTDVVRLDDEGRIAEVIGFLDGNAT